MSQFSSHLIIGDRKKHGHRQNSCSVKVLLKTCGQDWREIFMLNVCCRMLIITILLKLVVKCCLPYITVVLLLFYRTLQPSLMFCCCRSVKILQWCIQMFVKMATAWSNVYSKVTERLMKVVTRDKVITSYIDTIRDSNFVDTPAGLVIFATSFLPVLDIQKTV